MNITDDMIDAAVRAYNDADSTRHGLRAALAAALAAQSGARVPLTDAEADKVAADAGYISRNAFFYAFQGGIRAAERAHGITLADTEE